MAGHTFALRIGREGNPESTVGTVGFPTCAGPGGDCRRSISQNMKAIRRTIPTPHGRSPDLNLSRRTLRTDDRRITDCPDRQSEHLVGERSAPFLLPSQSMIVCSRYKRGDVVEEGDSALGAVRPDRPIPHLSSSPCRGGANSSDRLDYRRHRLSTPVGGNVFAANMREPHTHDAHSLACGQLFRPDEMEQIRL